MDAGSIPPGGCVEVSLSTKILVLDSPGLGLPPGVVVEATVSSVLRGDDGFVLSAH